MKKLLIIISSLIVLASCSKDINPDNHPATYVLASSVSSSTGGGWQSTNYAVNYEYNIDNQLFRVITNSKSKSTGYESNGLSTNIYTYDKDGYVIGSKTDMTSVSSDVNDISTTNVQYTYQKGRLSQQISNNVYDRTTLSTGKKETSTYQTTTNYTYDSKGNLTKILAESNSSSSGIYKTTTFLTDGKITKRLYQSGNGPETEYETFSNGLVVQNKNGTSTSFYKYDGSNHLIRTERWEGGKQYTNYDQTYDSQKSTSLASPTAFFKGWPKPTNEMGDYSNNVLNTKIGYIQPNGSVSENENNYYNTYQFNEKGFPSKKTFSGKWNSANYSGQEVYTYIDLSQKN